MRNCRVDCCCVCIHADSGVCDIAGEVGCGYSCGEWDSEGNSNNNNQGGCNEEHNQSK